MPRPFALLAAFTVAVIGIGYVNPSSSGQPAGATGRPPIELAYGAQTNRREVARLIAAYENDGPGQRSAGALQTLAQLYLQRGRLSGDVATYAQARSAIERSLVLAPHDRSTRTLLAGIRFTTHDFATAEHDATVLLSERPDESGPLAILGDAQLELGEYGAAAQSYAILRNGEPDAAAATVRAARLAFLQGRTNDARRLADEAKAQAVASAFGDAGLGFYSTFQGQVSFDLGEYGQAARYYTQALRESPGYHIALVGLAKARAAQGHRSEAIKLYQRAIAVVPQPDAVAALGDLYQLGGDKESAQRQYDTVEVIASLAAINKQVYNRALASFYADHDRHRERALSSAEQELAVRHDIYGYDILAWSLYRNGRFVEAKAASGRALALGTQDAKLFFHAGMIDKALGDGPGAAAKLTRALSISPQFDPLQAAAARQALRHLATADLRNDK